VTNVAVLLVVALIAWYLVSTVRRHRRGLVAERGISIGADLGTLGDTPRVRVNALQEEGPDRYRLILTPETGPDDEPSLTGPSDLDLLVFLREEEFGYGVLQEWKRSESPIAIVQPPGSHIVRLRSVDSLQHLTLRRVDEG
jgi:hypothetical protein